jgi:hypothetical protein
VSVIEMIAMFPSSSIGNGPMVSSIARRIMGLFA